MAKQILSIVLVNYNFGEYIWNCLESLKKVNDEVEMEVWVVDNDSCDDSVEGIKDKFKWVRLIENKENIGFGRGCNQALRQIKSGYVLLLNPDTMVGSGLLSGMVEYMDNNPEVGAATCQIRLENGEVDLAAHRGFPTPMVSLLHFFGNDNIYHLKSSDMTVPHEVDVISGAFFFSRAEILREVDYFDEDYFMYAEDIDLSYKIKQAGYKIIYLPQLEILHIKGVASGIKKHSQVKTTATMETRLRSLNYFYSTMIIFYDKHYKKKYPVIVNWLVHLSINLRWWLAKRKMTV